jgi:small subunit ribosomal protein S25e
MLQKWSKGKVREKLANAIFFDQKLYDRMLVEVPKVSMIADTRLRRFRAACPSACSRKCLLQMKMISVSTVSERLKIGGSLARATLKDLVTKGVVRVVSYHSKGAVYTRATNTE